MHDKTKLFVSNIFAILEDINKLNLDSHQDIVAHEYRLRNFIRKIEIKLITEKNKKDRNILCALLAILDRDHANIQELRK